MAYYYDQFDSSTNAGAVLWVGDVGYSGNGVTVSWEGGWHSFAGSWYVSGIYNSIGRDAGAGEVRRDYVDDGSVSGSGDKWFTSYTETFPRYSYNYNVTLYSYVRASVNGATREAQAEYTFTVPAIPPAFNTLNATRVSDNQANLSWTAASGNISAVCIERSVDGGSFSEVAVIWSASATSWQDTATTADHSYTYRARYHHSGAYGPYSNTVTVTMTPSAPQTISTAAAGGTNINVTLDNPSPVAIKVQYQISTDGGSNWGNVTDSLSLTSFTVSASGTVRVRVRNYNSTGESAWLESGDIVTICPPNPPTITNPTSNIVNLADTKIEYQWLFNSLDGSDQTAYKVGIKVNGGAESVTQWNYTTKRWTRNISGNNAGDVLEVRFKTRGASTTGGTDNDGFSDWSATKKVTLYNAPTLSITSPSATVTGMPISLTATYSDMAGFTCQAATVSLQKDGRTLYTENAAVNGTSITSSLDVSEFLPDNGESYTVVLTARSSSGLSTSANATFTVDFVEPQAGELNISNDPETGYASLLATFDNSASEITYSGATNSQFDTTEGYVRSLTVEGMSQKWNQLFPDNRATETANGVTMTNSGGGKYTFTGTSTTNREMLGTRINTPIGHKFYFFGNSGGTKMSSQSSTDNDGRGNFWENNTSSATRWFVFYVANGTTVNTTFTPAVIDLTAIYGSGNEPTTLDDPRIAFLKAYALAHPAYDAGSLISIESAGVRGRNLADLSGMAVVSGGVTYTTDGSSITLSGTSGGSEWSTASSRVYIPVEPNTAYTISLSDKPSDIFNGFYISFWEADENKANVVETLLATWGTTADLTEKTVTTRSNTRYLNVRCGARYANTPTNVTVDVMLELGSTAHAYEPYSLTTITTSLRSAGSVHDTLMADEDSYTVRRNVGVLTLDGTEANWTTWNSSAIVAGGKYYYVNQSYSNEVANKSSDQILVSGGFLARASYTQLAPYPGSFYFDSAYYPSFLVSETDFPTLADFKTWLGTHPVTIYYQKKTPTVDTETSISRIEIGSAFTVGTELDSTFTMTTWDGSADAVSISVSRVNADGTITPLITDGASGSGVVDRYAPLNTPYQYAVTTKAASKAVKWVYVDAILNTRKWFAYSGDIIAAADYTTGGTKHSYSRPNRVRVHYVGRKDPVSYDDGSVDFSVDTTFFTIDKTQADAFERIMENDARGIVKTGDGLVYHADFDISTSNTLERNYSGKVIFKAYRISGEKL